MITKQELTNFYIIEAKTAKEISEITKIPKSTIMYYITKWKLTKRTIKEYDSRLFQRKEISSEEIIELYVNQNKSTVEVGRILGVNSSTIISRLKKLNIPRRPWGADLINKQYGKLFVISKTNSKLYLCRCECGVEKNICRYSILNHENTSCGCNRKSSNNHRWNGAGELGGTYLSNIRASAKNRDLECTIITEQIWNLFLQQNRKCALTGLDLVLPNKTNQLPGYKASLDRIDNNKGYIISNVRWVWVRANFARQNMSDEEFFLMSKLIVEHNKI